ncbi:type II toxin-antitoxin system PemK/MazF family toxin [Microcoleus sp. D2_18a_D3]|uniref:type II toxin-antitoxin system PemK/MazF family toxin n=1 Tax=Microcoleus sp. D2_18a_D3 TaxID=3055330 RepID=UPI002FD2ADEE
MVIAFLLIGYPRIIEGIRTNFDVEIQEWQQAGLKRPSVVRLHKVNTLQKSLVERRLGILTPDDLAQVRDRVKQIWSFI